MTTSHLLGLIPFGFGALFALLCIIKKPSARRNPTEHRHHRAAVFFLIGGAVLGYLVFWIDSGVRVTTLYEVMLEGSGNTPGDPAPLRTVTFTVEHPNVEHELLVAPTARAFKTPTAPVNVMFALNDPNGETVLSERTQRFDVRPASRNSRADWDSHTYPFTPKTTGTYTLQITPLTVGIPRIHVHIKDPLKTDGKRIPGY